MSERIKKQDFIDLYTVQWMATHSALNYEAACASGDHDSLTDESVVDEAKTYATAAWKSFMARRDLPCHCQLEAGDSECPMHGMECE